MVIVALVAVTNVWAGCWSDWSRCTGWSSVAGGVAWQECNTRCKCQGYSSGTCEDVANSCWFLNKKTKVSRCVCHGRKVIRNVPKSCGF
ncbi:unnamed protein product [Oppiella nova]|uniref:Theromacin n=1 Tax=Oppiella nova TaxID=334625 RepID=A0A7R9MT45_9ACAR|nr:unnamed protein product [Oppiella nova]CAG2183162.1 unnamed protein product [Oppiella nova]